MSRSVRTSGSLVALGAVAIVVLLICGSQSLPVREFALGSPAQGPVATLRPGQQVCEGPVTSPRDIQQARIWGGSSVGSAGVRVDLRDARSGRSLAGGPINATVVGAQVAALNGSVPGGRPLRVCVRDIRNSFTVFGSAAVAPYVVMSGGSAGSQFSLALLNVKRSLLGSLPLAFSRASLFKPSWVGAWAFWALTIALLAAFGLGAVAVTKAADDDRAQSDRN